MENRKEQIIEVALKRFAHFGFHKTTMNEIADDLRITKANLYYYYPDKPSLILDVLCAVITELHGKESDLIEEYQGDLMSSIDQLLELKASFMKKYYVFHINENLDWIKGIDIAKALAEFNKKDILIMKSLLEKAVANDDLKLENLEDYAQSFTEILKGLDILHTVSDIITGIPNESNVDKILSSQKRAARLIFEGKLIRK
ncbi:TetR/AcrR family transcriptional regulator [Sphingobacterium sp. HJSM2_6]|uniref:TetR/AcrR family transcriptional regulator n=1 Tax=Sphingobacterium sp. HJSM2_6 TaxID=3366264 RepID=UPI003BD05667